MISAQNVWGRVLEEQGVGESTKMDEYLKCHVKYGGVFFGFRLVACI